MCLKVNGSYLWQKQKWRHLLNMHSSDTQSDGGGGKRKKIYFFQSGKNNHLLRTKGEGGPYTLGHQHLPSISLCGSVNGGEGPTFP